MNLNQKKDYITLTYPLHSSPWRFFFSYLVYGMFSIILFILTSDGWSVLFPAYGGLLLLIISSLYLLTWAIINRNKNPIPLPWNFIFIVFILQFFALLLNYGDCGNTFIERLTGLKANSGSGGVYYGVLCKEAESILTGSGAFYISILTTLLYITALASLLLRLTTNIKSGIKLAISGIGFVIIFYFVFFNVMSALR